MHPIKIMTLTIMASTVVAHAAAQTSNRSWASAHIFSPGVISGPDGDMTPGFASGGSRLYFTRSYPDTSAIMISDKKDASWSTPVVAPFSGHWRDLELAIAPNGAYAVFASNRRIPGKRIHCKPPISANLIVAAISGKWIWSPGTPCPARFHRQSMMEIRFGRLRYPGTIICIS